ncbi:MAG: adenylate/guanylate cyclase domain-containing protein [Gammaproteobacteria bacterium]|nr:adenylate/guanylate cyclase domain-containing protein [Gammaproteobacteria bacterium]
MIRAVHTWFGLTRGWLFRVGRELAMPLARPLLVGSGIALLGIGLAVSPAGHWLEEEIGLVWLFKWRGPITPPPEVVIVSIDNASSKHLGLPNKPRLWPRSLHAELLTQLKARGAKSIFFDIIFEEPRDPQDNQRLAAAIRAAGNVVLFQYMQREVVPLASNGSEIYVEHLNDPLAVLRDAAFGMAPFPLPKVPAKVNHFLLFKPELGDIPTMPVAVLQTYTRDSYDEMLALLRRQGLELPASLPRSALQLQQHGKVNEVVKQLRQWFLAQPQLDTSSFTKNTPLRNLIATYRAPRSVYLNFYGPPRTLTTIPYYQVLQNTSHVDLRGKAVFVGFSEELQPEQKDGFYTVYTNQRSGLDISGVEVGATAFANLLHQHMIQTPAPGYDVLLLVSWGLILGFALPRLQGWRLPAGIGVIGVGYALLVYNGFTRYYLWLPLIIPLLWQLPLAVTATLVTNYRALQRERRNIRRAFGLHLPIAVVDQLANGVEHLTAAGHTVHGIVMATDAEQYTSLSERLGPTELHSLMNRYYAAVFSPIRQHHGIVSDVVGDAVLALWAARHADVALRRQACHAAMAVRDAVAHFNHSNAPLSLPTRIGLHTGDVVMGHIGALDHYEYRAVGDIVNTATRIEGLNKILGTRIIVSASVLAGVDGLISRELGTFVLAGKQQPLTLHELICGADQQLPVQRETNELFAQALQAFRAQAWDEARVGFETCLQCNSVDGPARFYLIQCQHYLQHTPEAWDGAIRLSQK